MSLTQKKNICQGKIPWKFHREPCVSGKRKK